jgi:predicted homoserine dehydrogenase-like protein
LLLSKQQNTWKHLKFINGRSLNFSGTELFFASSKPSVASTVLIAISLTGMKKYKVGIVGYGGFGKFLHYWWAKLPNVEVVAISDSSNHCESADCKAYQNWKDLVKDPEVDIVSIVTPPALHAEMACLAMKANKHVLLETYSHN